VKCPRTRRHRGIDDESATAEFFGELAADLGRQLRRVLAVHTLRGVLDEQRRDLICPAGDRQEPAAAPDEHVDVLHGVALVRHGQFHRIAAVAKLVLYFGEGLQRLGRVAQRLIEDLVLVVVQRDLCGSRAGVDGQYPEFFGHNGAPCQ
jgi:hypothetical protein